PGRDIRATEGSDSSHSRSFVGFLSVPDGALGNDNDLHVSGKIDNALDEGGGEPGPKRAWFLSRHEDLRDAVESCEVDNGVGYVRSFQNARLDTEPTREIQMPFEVLSFVRF